MNEETGKKELVKTGTKMRVESEFGFEPSLLVEMERVKNGAKLIHRATVLGDRFGLVDGKSKDNPTYGFFAPHVQQLKPGAHAPIDTSIKTAVDVDEDGNADWQREKKQRAILCEEIQGELLRYYPGQKTEDKQGKLDIIEMAFNTRSWTKVEGLDSSVLREGLQKIRQELSLRFGPQQAGLDLAGAEAGQEAV